MRLVLAAALAGGALSLPAHANPPPPIGAWSTEEGDSRIRLAPCGRALCGTIVWVRQPGTDSKNPNPALRGRSLVGLELTRDMEPDGQGGWSGSIYNPDNGKTYGATMRPRGAKLEVGGCIMGGLLCGSDTWSRASEETASTTLPSPRR